MTEKKKKIIGLLVIIIILSVGATYAWWKMKVKTVKEIAMGDLGITATFSDTTDDELYEPGLSVDFDGEIKNTGKLPVFIKVVNGSEINFKYSDDDFTPNGANTFVPDKENAVILNFKPKTDNYEEEDVFWFNKKGNMEEKYILLEADANVQVTNVADLDGDKMGNKYQEAKIKVGGDIIATQVIEGAMLSEFNVTLDDLEEVQNSTRQMRAYSQLNSSSSSKGMERLRELASRK